ncbi:hypothetical protein SK128_009768, partial [Halocaridina rubra]
MCRHEKKKNRSDNIIPKPSHNSTSTDILYHPRDGGYIQSLTSRTYPTPPDGEEEPSLPRTANPIQPGEVVPSFPTRSLPCLLLQGQL